MAIVSQDVLLFSGSVRENLDPRGENLDREILSVIEQCQLSGVVSNFETLDSPLKGEQLSAGERQLFCLARALLSRAKVSSDDYTRTYATLYATRFVHVNASDSVLVQPNHVLQAGGWLTFFFFFSLR